MTVGTDPDLESGRDPWSKRAAGANGTYRFLDGPAPDSVNPSLWRQSILNAVGGLFEVMPGNVNP